jgi:prephenate dehydratase
MKVGYRRAPASRAETAAGSLFPDVELVALASFDDVFAGLARREIDAAVLPVENTYAGAIVDVYDLLRAHRDTRVIGEAILREDREGAETYTRYFAVGRSPGDGPRSHVPAAAATKTSLVYATKNVPGALIRSLQPFAVARIQLTKIESRPSRDAAWEYVFYLDFEGDPQSQHVADALEVMRASCAWVHILGTYPAASTAAAEAVA